MKRLIIFDLDGTLIDTLNDLKNAVNYALDRFSFPLRTKEDIRKDIGDGTIKLIQRSSPKELNTSDVLNLHTVFKNYYSNHMLDFTKPYPGITSLLISLKTKGYKLAVLSNKDHDVTVKIINTFFAGLFDYIQGSYMEHPKKPDPYLANKIMDELELTRDEITYIGDTNVDEQTAINAKVDYIIVSYGYRTKEELHVLIETKNIVDSVKELESKLKR